MIIQKISLIGKRQKNEDRLDFQEDNDKYFFAVYDGHGGKHVSSYLTKNMNKYFMNKKISTGYVDKVFSKIENKLLDHKFAHECGSTALLLILDKKKKNNTRIVNLGDCRAILGNKYNMAIQLTIDHKPDYYKERQRISKMGKTPVFDDDDNNWRIEGYSLSRAFGDNNYKTISSKPDIYNYILSSKDKFLIMACDGLWDVMSNQDAINFVNKYMEEKNFKLRNISSKSHDNVAYALANYAIKLGSYDNVSLFIIFL